MMIHHGVKKKGKEVGDYRERCDIIGLLAG